MGLFSSKVKDPKPTAHEKALAVDAVAKFNEHQQNFVPLENSFISQLTATAGERGQQRGIAAADIAQASAGRDNAIVRGSRGQFGQGKSIIARAGVSSDIGAARGDAVTGADTALRNRELSGLAKMSAFGRGLQDTNSVSLRDAAQRSTSAAINKLNISIKNRGTMVDGIGTFAGTAIGNYGTAQSIKESF